MNLHIYQPWGGLGDNLCFSTIPELCHLNGKKCIIKRDNAYRNKNIEEFVWDINPFIEKESEINNIDNTIIAQHRSLPNKNVIECAEYGSNFPITNHYPKIYYTPKKLEEFKNKIIIDTKSVSIEWQHLDNKIYELIKDYKKDSILIFNEFTRPKDYSVFSDIETLNVQNLFYYSDIINSCKAMYIVSSGISVLAPAIKYQMNLELEINVITDSRFIPQTWDGGYWFNNVNYII